MSWSFLLIAVARPGVKCFCVEMELRDPLLLQHETSPPFPSNPIVVLLFPRHPARASSVEASPLSLEIQRGANDDPGHSGIGIRSRRASFYLVKIEIAVPSLQSQIRFELVPEKSDHLIFDLRAGAPPADVACNREHRLAA